ncbi:hypothetical protein Y032_0009g421 [Ancylostoma ceylanicum]|uniref:Endonuclease/exonuclease/phosphatase domain-containing protein n=1 Tax=Ancylostoma ceylanicum TaxID=53326 RepID=A0A016VHK5_9BILA|nr:hypothetical protein Y032_0009g421 [Ancylostoma ceylanicum]
MRGLPANRRSRPKTLVIQHEQQHPQSPVRLATLNVGTLTARSRELASNLRSRRVDICCIQETRWEGSKCAKIGDGYRLMYHGTSDRNGVCIVISETFRNYVTAVDCISDRLMGVKVDTGKVTMRIISAYAPQVGCTAEQKSSFYEDLEQYVHSIEYDEVLLLGGDLNGHIGEKREGFDRWHGGYGYGTCNEEGQRILEFEPCLTSSLLTSVPSYTVPEEEVTLSQAVAEKHKSTSGC